MLTPARFGSDHEQKYFIHEEFALQARGIFTGIPKLVLKTITSVGNTGDMLSISQCLNQRFIYNKRGLYYKGKTGSRKQKIQEGKLNY